MEATRDLIANHLQIPADAIPHGDIHVRRDPAGNIKTDKQKSTEKIDGVVATIMALDHAIRGGNANAGVSVYDSRGLLLI